MEMAPDIGDKPSVQRGAKVFVNYCMGCHSIEFMRYSRMGRDIGLTDEQVEENLLFTADKVQARMDIAMAAEDAERWFGVAPPDLSVIARSRGPNWLYTYLLTFYEDPSPARPFGVNNIAFPDVGMPHVLWPLQGIQQYVKEERPEGVVAEHLEGIEPADDGVHLHKALETEDGTVHVVDKLQISRAGMLQPAEYRKTMRDLVNFLVYVGEPAKLVRYQIGFWVLVFLAILFVLSRALYKEYWKDVH